MLKEQEASPTGGKTIVVVEDDESNRKVFEMAIASETSYKTVMVSNGDEMLQRVEEIRALKPALFILDYNLPRMNALELYDRLHHLEGLEHIPALIITAEAHEVIATEVSQRNLAMLEKPFDLDDLVAIIEQTIENAS